MMDEICYSLAVDHVLGTLDPRLAPCFEKMLEEDAELVALVNDFRAIRDELKNGSKTAAHPSPALFTRIEAEISGREAAPEDGMVLTNREGRIIWINDAFTRLCGYEMAEVRGKKPGEFLQGPLTDSNARLVFRRAVEEGRGCVSELINYHKNGSPYWVRVALNPVLDESGVVSRYIALERKIERRICVTE